MNMTKSQIEARDAAIDAAAEREGRSIRLARGVHLVPEVQEGWPCPSRRTEAGSSPGSWGPVRFYPAVGSYATPDTASGVSLLRSLPMQYI